MYIHLYMYIYIYICSLSRVFVIISFTARGVLVDCACTVGLSPSRKSEP